ncbi:hypothetical protein CYMTET_31916 [Cymbomonas tetramitiformis]|uniref:Uncharacterized protein n=1 Tax=Cymbomonas tetramitiformis TaxID=36881 RepID=A0AAE0FG25_9CHLO|nr:hypothetical protein CYMTET_31916 [Cymbomonas tetramitiformis]
MAVTVGVMAMVGGSTVVVVGAMVMVVGATVMEVEAMVVEVKGWRGPMAMEVVEMVVVGGDGDEMVGVAAAMEEEEKSVVGGTMEVEVDCSLKMKSLGVMAVEEDHARPKCV